MFWLNCCSSRTIHDISIQNIKHEDLCFSFTDYRNDLNDLNDWMYQSNGLLNSKEIKPFVPPIQQGIVIKVYDGDTITIAAKLPYNESPIYKFSIRLSGIDCPEIKGKNDSEKICAEIAKKLLNDLILNRIVYLENVATEKYGRILADVYYGDLHINDYMLKKILAVKYYGGTKTIPNDWLAYYNDGII